MVGIRKQKIGRRLGKQTGVGMEAAVSKWPEIGSGAGWVRWWACD